MLLLMLMLLLILVPMLVLMLIMVLVITNITLLIPIVRIASTSTVCEPQLKLISIKCTSQPLDCKPFSVFLHLAFTFLCGIQLLISY